jgi:hypothetical protein
MKNLLLRARCMLSFLSFSHPRDTLVFEKERLIEAGPCLRISQPPFSRSQGRLQTTSRNWLWPSNSRTSIPVNYWCIAYWKGYERKWLGLIRCTIPVFSWKKWDIPNKSSVRIAGHRPFKCRTGILIDRNVQIYDFPSWRLFSFHAQKASSLPLGDQSRTFSTNFYSITFSWSNMYGNPRCVHMFRLQKNKTDFHGI